MSRWRSCWAARNEGEGVLEPTERRILFGAVREGMDEGVMLEEISARIV